MALVAIEGIVEFKGIANKLRLMGRRDFRDAFYEIKPPALRDQRDHRNRMRGPKGAWPFLASTTLKRYARSGKRRNRQILGRLPMARLTKITGDFLLIRSRVPWSMAHQDGPTVVGHGSILPQRQFFWISKWLADRAREIFERAMIKRWQGF